MLGLVFNPNPNSLEYTGGTAKAWKRHFVAVLAVAFQLSSTCVGCSGPKTETKPKRVSETKWSAPRRVTERAALHLGRDSCHCWEVQASADVDTK